MGAAEAEGFTEEAFDAISEVGFSGTFSDSHSHAGVGELVGGVIDFEDMVSQDFSFLVDGMVFFGFSDFIFFSEGKWSFWHWFRVWVYLV